MDVLSKGSWCFFRWRVKRHSGPVSDILWLVIPDEILFEDDSDPELAVLNTEIW